MDMLTSLTIKEFANKMATQEPPPGGGSTAALAGLMGASLLEMVINLSIDQADLAKHFDFLASTKKDLERLHVALEDLVNRDAWVFQEVMVAFKMPKESPKEKELQEKAIQTTMQGAAEVPLEIARACLEVLEISQHLLGKIHVHAIGDLTVAALAGHTGTLGALLSTAMNLPFLKDEALVKALEGQIILIRSSADELIKAVQETVYSMKTFAVMKA